jgi:hypothetical protein
VCKTPENLGQAVVDLQLREKEEENKAISEQLKKMIVEEEQLTKRISDLELHLEAANHEAGSLKASNLELERKVCTFVNTFLTLVGVNFSSRIFTFLYIFLAIIWNRVFYSILFDVLFVLPNISFPSLLI